MPDSLPTTAKSRAIAQGRKAILQHAGLKHFKRDLRSFTAAELDRHFASARSGRIVLARLIRNIIWQAYERIQAGTEPPIGGNLRTFWYLWVKPVLARTSGNDDAKMDPYDVMLRAFSEMVLSLRLFKYADFDFTDENWENRRIGTLRPEQIVFTEKRGWIRFLREVHEQLGTSTLALGGAPSALTSEYTADHIRQAAGPDKLVRLIGVVDYDPAGESIATSFRGQLEACGLAVEGLETLIHPRHYSAAELEMFRFPLPTKQTTKNERWMERTGGIGGKPFGLESESMPRARVRELLEQLVV
jgi:hypothetical protein